MTLNLKPSNTNRFDKVQTIPFEHIFLGNILTCKSMFHIHTYIHMHQCSYLISIHKVVCCTPTYRQTPKSRITSQKLYSSQKSCHNNIIRNIPRKWSSLSQVAIMMIVSGYQKQKLFSLGSTVNEEFMSIPYNQKNHNQVTCDQSSHEGP